MPGVPVKIGPWPGGLNLRDDPREIADNELTECVNFDVMDDGTLEPRRQLLNSTTTLPAGTRYLLGSVNEDGVLRAMLSLASPSFGADNSGFYYTENGDTYTRAFDSAVKPGRYSAVVSYNYFIWGVPLTPTGVGFKTGHTSSTLTTVNTIPYGNIAFMLKDRMFVVRKATSRVYYSKATDPSIWTSPDGGFFDINPGDGLEITDIIVLNNQLIIFKQDATYTFNYNSDPAADGNLTVISPDQGAFSAIAYNNEVYGINNKSIFKFINGYFIDIAEKLDIFDTVKFHTVLNPFAFLSIINDTLLAYCSGKFYAMNLTTGAWSQYTFAYPDVRFPVTLRIPFGKGLYCRNTQGSFIVFATLTDYLNIPYFALNRTVGTSDADSAGALRYPEYSFKTKSFVFEDEIMWKKLFSWATKVSYPIEPVLNLPSRSTVKVNDELENHTFDFLGKITAKALRFKSISFKWSSRWYEAVPLIPGPFTLLNTGQGYTKNSVLAPTIHSITAWISSKTPVSK